MLPKSNLVILTSGLSGSSLLTGLISRAGYWLGKETINKNNSSGRYQTFENSELVAINQQLLKHAKIQEDSLLWYKKEAFEYFCQASNQKIVKGPLVTFIEKENNNSPWLWKDPRMWITFGSWVEHLPQINTKIIVLKREPLDLWLSQVNKRMIYDFHFLKEQEEKSAERIETLLKQNEFDYKTININNFIKSPDTGLTKLNQFLNTQLTIEDWQAIYSAPPSTQPIKRLILGSLIYFKNYSTRIRNFEV